MAYNSDSSLTQQQIYQHPCWHSDEYRWTNEAKQRYRHARYLHYHDLRTRHEQLRRLLAKVKWLEQFNHQPNKTP